MTSELQKEFNELNKFKEFVYLFWDFIDEINYDEEHFSLTITFNELVLNTQEIVIFVEKRKSR